MSEIIKIKRNTGCPSQILVGDVVGQLESLLPNKRVIVITDTNIHRHHKELIDIYEHLFIGMGETNKTLITASKLYDELIAINVDRDCFILGVGGGIVSDIAGFVASTYMRGLNFGFIATSLLSQVDASIGGKNGINIGGYKNMVGTFNQPDFVLCDTMMLKTLPDREFISGIAEVVKAAIIADPDLFTILQQHDISDFRKDQILLEKIVVASIKVKATIVERDERETGERKKLNLGHTIAHAIEKCSTQYNHGEAVAIGCVMIAELSARMGLLDHSLATDIKNVFNKLGLPVEIDIDRKKLLAAIKLDKKRKNDLMDFVLISDIGNCVIRQISIDELEGVIVSS